LLPSHERGRQVTTRSFGAHRLVTPLSGGMTLRHIPDPVTQMPAHGSPVTQVPRGSGTQMRPGGHSRPAAQVTVPASPPTPVAPLDPPASVAVLPALPPAAPITPPLAPLGPTCSAPPPPSSRDAELVHSERSARAQPRVSQAITGADIVRRRSHTGAKTTTTFRRSHRRALAAPGDHARRKIFSQLSGLFGRRPGRDRRCGDENERLWRIDGGAGPGASRAVKWRAQSLPPGRPQWQR
jgi:hypothetical protein